MSGPAPDSAAFLRGVVLRLVLAAAVCLPLGVQFGEPVVRASLPWISSVFSWVADDFKLLSLTIEDAGADRVVKATVMWQHIQVIGGKVIYPDPRGTATASTLLAHTLQGPLAALVAAIVWPLGFRGSRGWTEAMLRIVILVPMLSLLVIADTPLVLAGELWSMVLDALDPQATSLLVLWKSFLQSGGRYAMSVVLAVVATQLATRLVRQQVFSSSSGTSRSLTSQVFDAGTAN